MDTIMDNNAVSCVQQSKVGLYLRSRSRFLLKKYNEDATLAFAELKDEVINMFNVENVWV